MIIFTQGNLLDAEVEALVNTVNTVGVMGRGVALMFKEAFPENFEAYEAACKRGEVKIGQMFITERRELLGPRWIINFPTKAHWRFPSRLSWIESGLADLKRILVDRGIRSVALPPLGSGNGGLHWGEVRARIVSALSDLPDVNIIIYEPTKRYQNVTKSLGVEQLTPARALVAELIRRYWILGIECTLLEVHKLAYVLERVIEVTGGKNPLDLRFAANKYGPHAPRLNHLLNALDGSYLHCDKRLSDAEPFDTIWFDDSKKDLVAAYLTSPEAKPFRTALEATAQIIDGFESPLGLELLATVDWLLKHERVRASSEAVRAAICQWPVGGKAASERKARLFDTRLIELALRRLNESPLSPDAQVTNA